jgi:hypothetical protein
MKNPFIILFAGEPIMARLLDGSTLEVFVRLMPERNLLGEFLQLMEDGSKIVELCAYTKVGEGEAPAAAHPQIPPPRGYWSVPQHWADNLTDDSLAEIYELAKKLNFPRAAKLAEGRLAAKKMIAPLNARLMEQILPLVAASLETLLAKSSTSTPSAPSSPAFRASNS